MNPPSYRDDSKVGAEPKPIHLRLLFGPLFPSLIVAAIIAPYAPFGTMEYVRGYAFLFVVACALTMIGTKMNVSTIQPSRNGPSLARSAFTDCDCCDSWPFALGNGIIEMTTKPNKTDAGNGSYSICRIIDFSRSPSPDPSL